jgi:hypothetical protein
LIPGGRQIERQLAEQFHHAVDGDGWLAPLHDLKKPGVVSGAFVALKRIGQQQYISGLTLASTSSACISPNV